VENITAPRSVNTEALARLRAVFQLDKAAVCSLLSEWFYTYHADVYVHGVPFELYVRKVAGIVRELEGATRVLDLGAGFGVYSCLLRILGIPQVISMDYHREKSRDAAVLVSHLGLDGVQVLQGDALALPFSGTRFDGALALACLSHIREPEESLRNIARVLRPGGRVYVFEDNNSSYPGYEKHMTLQWEAAETGKSQEGLPPEKMQAESYIGLRRQAIQARFPELSAEALDHCARETRGLYGRAVLEAAEQYRGGKPILNPRRHLVCHPVSGEFEEYPLNPAIVRGMLENAGFETRLRSPHYGPFRGRFAALKALAAAVFRVCPAILPWTSPTFAVVATLK
jgi:SAM-dependent methyltransferase